MLRFRELLEFKVVDVDGHRWVQPDRAKRSREKVVVVDTQKLDHGWKKDDCWISPSGEGSIRGRTERFHQWRKDNPGTPIECPEVSVDTETGRVGFTNGRHRFSAMRDSGVKSVAVSVPAKHARHFEDNFGPDR
jgi:hypothetical protein